MEWRARRALCVCAPLKSACDMASHPMESCAPLKSAVFADSSPLRIAVTPVRTWLAGGAARAAALGAAALGTAGLAPPSELASDMRRRSHSLVLRKATQSRDLCS